MEQKQPIYVQLTDDQIEKIADRAVEKLYARIGSTVTKRALWILGLGVSALLSAALAVLFHK